MSNELPPLPNDLVEAIGAYWDTGYEEGKCGIGGDAASQCLSAVYERVRAYARAAVLAEREASAKLCEEFSTALDRHKWPTPDAMAAAIRARSTP